MTTPIVGPTPGPWMLRLYREPYAKLPAYGVFPESVRNTLDADFLVEPVCVIGRGRTVAPHDVPNGTLIAAAHDMVQALMDIDDWLVQGHLTGDSQYVTSAKQTVRDALDKALP